MNLIKTSPIFTSDTIDAPWYFSYSSNYDDVVSAYELFDGDVENMGWHSSVKQTDWETCEEYIILGNIASKIKLSTLKIYGRRHSDGLGQIPINFGVYGSNDNINYKLIKDFNYGTELDASFDLGRVYSYNYFKILFYDKSAGWGRIILDEMEFYYDKDIDMLLLLKSNNKYYSVQESQYNTSSQMFEEVMDITNNDVFFNAEDLFTEITIGDETFKPIDKFDKFQIVSKDSFELEVSALKSTQEMIATLEPLNMKKYATIHKITPNYDISGNGSIKIAFSFDDGVTWKTWDATNDWTDLSNVEIPLILYENFSDADKTAWSNAQAEINTNGIDIRNLSNVIFPTDVKKMCFAIVFNRPTYADTATLNSFDILYDGLKTYVGLDRDKCGVKFSGDTITVTPTSNADQLLITMIVGN